MGAAQQFLEAVEMLTPDNTLSHQLCVLKAMAKTHVSQSQVPAVYSLKKKNWWLTNRMPLILL